MRELFLFRKGRLEALRVIAAIVVCLLGAPLTAYAGRVNLAWDAIPAESAIVAGYLVYYGTASGTYTVSVNVGNVTSTTINGLTNGVTYFFAVKAYTAAGALSSFSNQVSGVPTNSAPVVTNPGSLSRKQGTLNIPITATDPDSDTLSYSATGLPSGTSIGVSTGVISGTASPGVYSVNVTASDGALQDSEAFTLTVTVNSAPSLTSPGPQSHDTDDTISLQLSATDPESDSIAYSAAGLPPGLTVHAVSGLISGTPSAGGDYSVTVSASDGSLTTNQVFNWTIVQLVPPDLVAHWKLDEGSGTLADDAVGSNNGTLQGGATWTAGNTGQAVSFDGTDDFISLPNMDVTGGTGLSITAWVKSSSFPSSIDQRIISKATDSLSDAAHYWMLSAYVPGSANPRLRFRLKTGGTTSVLIAQSGDLPTNQWYHVAATYDSVSENMKLYINGIEVGTDVKTGTVATSSSVPVNIGRNPEPGGGGSNYMFGAIDDVRIYRKGLTAAEVNAVMNAVASTSSLEFTDDPLVAGSTTVKAIHITEMRTRVNALRIAQALPEFDWAEDSLIGVTIKASHIVELRSALAGVYSARMLTAPNFTDTIQAGSTAVKALHITQLRQFIAAIE